MTLSMSGGLSKPKWRFAVPEYTTKTCSKCNATFPATTEHFQVKSRGKYGLNSVCKPCVKAHDHAYNQRPDVKDRNKSRPTWGQLHPAERNALQRKYYANHKDEINAKLKEQGHPGCKRYRLAHPDKVKAACKRWKEKDLDRARMIIRIVAAKRRTRVRNNGGEFDSTDVKIQLKAQGERCWWCSEKLNGVFHIDHRIPIAKGGSSDPGNLCLSCPTCNMKKHDKMPWEFNGRLL